MTAKLLKKAFDEYYSFPLSLWESIADLGEIVPVVKQQIIKENNKTENYLNFILKGSAGILLWNKNNFVCTDLFIEGDFFCDYLSFITRKSSPYEVLVFENSSIFRITYTALAQCLNESDYDDKFWRYSMQALYIYKHNQYIQINILTAAEIYNLFLKHLPKILERVPQKYIASYLAITPQSLSRIRSDL